MKDDLAKTVNDKIPMPLGKLSMPESLKADFEKGFAFEKTKDILTRGHIGTTVHQRVTLNKDMTDLMLSRAVFLRCLLLPTKLHFPTAVRSWGLCGDSSSHSSASRTSLALSLISR